MKTVVAALFAAAFLSLSLRAEEPKKDPAPAPAKEEQKGEGEKKFTNVEIGCARCAFKSAKECASAVRIDGKIYLLKALDSADAKTKKLVEACSGREEVKKAKVTGKIAEENGQKWWFIGELLMDD